MVFSDPLLRRDKIRVLGVCPSLQRLVHRWPDLGSRPYQRAEMPRLRFQKAESRGVLALVTPAADHAMHFSDDGMMLSLSTMGETRFEDILAICDGSVDGYAPPDGARGAHCDAVLALSFDDFEPLRMASQQNQSNQLAITNGTFARGPSATGFGRGMPGRGLGRGAPCGGAFGRGSGPPPKGRNAPMGSYLTTYRNPSDNRPGAYGNATNSADRCQATVGKVYGDMRQSRERMRTDQIRHRNAQRPRSF